MKWIDMGGEDDYKVWKKRISEHGVKHAVLKPGRRDAYLGIVYNGCMIADYVLKSCYFLFGFLFSLY